MYQCEGQTCGRKSVNIAGKLQKRSIRCGNNGCFAFHLPQSYLIVPPSGSGKTSSVCRLYSAGGREGSNCRYNPVLPHLVRRLACLPDAEKEASNSESCHVATASQLAQPNSGYSTNVSLLSAFC